MRWLEVMHVQHHVWTNCCDTCFITPAIRALARLSEHGQGGPRAPNFSSVSCRRVSSMGSRSLSASAVSKNTLPRASAGRAGPCAGGAGGAAASSARGASTSPPGVPPAVAAAAQPSCM
jgi:hypothetical protein